MSTRTTYEVMVAEDGARTVRKRREEITGGRYRLYDDASGALLTDRAATAEEMAAAAEEAAGAAQGAKLAAALASLGTAHTALLDAAATDPLAHHLVTILAAREMIPLELLVARGFDPAAVPVRVR